MKRYLHQKELLWTVIGGLIIWNVGLTFRTSPQTTVTLDMVKVIRSAAQSLAEASEGEDLEAAKNKLAYRLRSTVQAYADKQRVVVVDASTILAGDAVDITEVIIKEVTR
jgi:Skp family chaperone for outer membrane proteins